MSRSLMEQPQYSIPDSSLSTLRNLQEGVAALSRGTYFREASLDMTLSILTESAAQMSGVERVSIWAVTDGQKELRCLEYYLRSAARHGSGGSLRAERYPAYFQALARESCIAADDPYAHPATAELSADYLPEHKISARLDTPIHIRGEWQGVLSLEQVGGRVPWTGHQRLFAQAVANLVTLALVEYEANEARRKAQSANERLKAVFEASSDALMLVDGETGVVLDVNREAEKRFGYPRRELIGKHQRMIYPLSIERTIGEKFRQTVAGNESPPLVTEVRCCSGVVMPVVLLSEMADVSDGRRVVLGIFRPI